MGIASSGGTREGKTHFDTNRGRTYSQDLDQTQTSGVIICALHDAQKVATGLEAHGGTCGRRKHGPLARLRAFPFGLHGSPRGNCGSEEHHR